MIPIRLREPEDYEPAARCASCEEPVLLSEAAHHDGNYYHPDCIGEVRCVWCGEFLPKENAKTIGKEHYHNHCFQDVQ